MHMSLRRLEIYKFCLNAPLQWVRVKKNEGNNRNCMQQLWYKETENCIFNFLYKEKVDLDNQRNRFHKYGSKGTKLALLISTIHRDDTLNNEWPFVGFCLGLRTAMTDKSSHLKKI